MQNVQYIKSSLDNVTEQLQNQLKNDEKIQAQNIQQYANDTLVTNTILGQLANMLRTSTGLTGNNAFVIGVAIALALVGVVAIYSGIVASYLLRNELQRQRALKQTMPMNNPSPKRVISRAR
jgi:ADP-heptose:LPS heptosyltransferase